MIPSLHLIDYQGHLLPGRATIEQITDVLEGRETDRLAIVTLVDGALAVEALDAAALDVLRVDIVARRRAALRVVLDAALATVRGADGLPGVRAASMFSGLVSIDIGDAPWAEDVALTWAHEKALHVDGAPPPSSGKWDRRAEIKLDDSSYAQSVASMRWPTVVLSPEESVARDADEAGRTAEAVALRSAAATDALGESHSTRQAIPRTALSESEVDSGMPF